MDDSRESKEESVADTYIITPHIIERWVIADKVEVVDATHPDDGERALLVFTDEDKAETFRREAGKYPAEEGFEVVAVDHEGLRNIVRTWGFRTIALVGLASDGGADGFDAEGFCEMLEEVA